MQTKQKNMKYKTFFFSNLFLTSRKITKQFQRLYKVISTTLHISASDSSQRLNKNIKRDEETEEEELNMKQTKCEKDMRNNRGEGRKEA